MTPFPRGKREHRGQTNQPGLPVDCGGLHVCNLVLAQDLADDIEPARERGVAKGPVGVSREGDRIVATSNFSGLASSARALTSAAAMVPIDSVQRCMARLRLEEIEAD
jgi:hypothetical protein